MNLLTYNLFTMDIYFFADVELQIMIDIRNVNNKILIYNIYNINIIYIIY